MTGPIRSRSATRRSIAANSSLRVGDFVGVELEALGAAAAAGTGSARPRCAPSPRGALPRSRRARPSRRGPRARRTSASLASAQRGFGGAHRLARLGDRGFGGGEFVRRAAGGPLRRPRSRASARRAWRRSPRAPRRFPRSGAPCRRGAARPRRRGPPSSRMSARCAATRSRATASAWSCAASAAIAACSELRAASFCACAAASAARPASGSGSAVRRSLRGRAARPRACSRCSARSASAAASSSRRRGEPVARRFGLVERAQGLALGFGGFAGGAFGGDQRRAAARTARPAPRAAPPRRSAAASRFGGQRGVELGEAVLGFEPRRFGRAFAARDEAVPAAQRARAGDQPFAGAERAAVVGLGDMDQRQPRGELGRAIADMLGEALRRRARAPRRRSRTGLRHRPAATPSGERGVAPERRGQRAFVARRGAQSGRAPRAGRACPPPAWRAPRGRAARRLPFALDPGQFGARGGERARRFVARRRSALPCRACARDRAPRAPSPAPRSPASRALPRRRQRLLGIALRGQRAALLVDPPRLAVEPRQPRFGLRHFGLGDAPFGFDPGVVGGRLGQRQLGRAAGVFLGLDSVRGTRAGALRRPPARLRPPPGPARASCSASAASRVSRSASPRSSSSRWRCRSRSARRCSAASSWLDSDAMRWPCALASSRRSASSSRASASLSASAACASCASLRRGLCLFDAGFGAPWPAARAASAAAAASRQRANTSRASACWILSLKRLVALGLPGLAAQRGDLAVEPGHQVLEPGEVGFGLLAACPRRRGGGRAARRSPPLPRASCAARPAWRRSPRRSCPG